jgi:MFS transporter, DHA1 family, inner membrane transport protein
MQSSRPPVAAPHGVRLAELALATGGLALGTGEFASMGLLPYVAASDRVSIPTMGHMISAYALGVVIGAPVITVLLAKAPRRIMLIALMSLFALGNLMSAWAPSYPLMVLARFLAGLPHGAYFGVASLVAASLVPANRRAQAVGRVMLGLSVANVIGVPLATGLGQAVGWRSAFLVVATLGLLTAGLVRLFTPEIAADAGASARRELSVFARPQVWLTLGVAAVGFGGVFAVYSYITPTLVHVTHLPAAATPLLLSVIGVGMIVGAMAGGWLADRAQTAAIFAMLGWSALVLGGFVLAAHSVWSVTPNLFLVGCCIAVVPALQTRLMDVAGEAQTIAAALNHSAFNIANALGAWLGGTAIAAGLGWASTGAVGAALALGGLAIMAVAVAAERMTPAATVPAAACP